MSAQTLLLNDELTERIAAEHAAVADALPTTVIDLAQRRGAMDAFAQRGLPRTRDENWRYANLRPLQDVRFAPPASDTRASVTTARLPAAIKGYTRYTFVDGRFVPALSSTSPQPGVSLDSALQKSASPSLSVADWAEAPFALLNEAFAIDGLRIAVTEAPQPTCMEIIFVASTSAQDGASYPRVTVQAGPKARIGLIERHISLEDGDKAFVDSAVSISLDRGARLDHYRVQQTGELATWLDTLSARLADDATYCLHLVSLGALSARSSVHIQLAGARAQLSLHAVSVADRDQVHDTFAVVEHAAPQARTEQSFRGIAAGRARVGFSGKIVVREGAQGTQSRQSLRGLLAGPQAEIDVRPQLEIYTDDVQCSHGATAGKLDENMLFYLLSRGLEKETAQQLLKWAFLEDVVSKIEVAELRRQIELSLAGQMSEARALRELL